MNTKQFISSALLSGADFGVSRVPVIGKIAAMPLKIIFPTMLYEQVSFELLKKRTFFLIFLWGLLLCFGLQALLAYQAGTLGELDRVFEPTTNNGVMRIMFFDDIHNLANYVVLVPLYLVAGTGYLISVLSMNERIAAASKQYEFDIPAPAKTGGSGVALFGSLALIVTLAQAQYAVDLHSAQQLYWFHSDSVTDPFRLNGYAYLAINIFLCMFVAFIALAHLELFRWSRILTDALRDYNPGASEKNVFVNEGDRIKEIFAPFTETAIWSKAFAMLLGTNIYTWKASGVSAAAGIDTASFVDDGLFIRLTFVVYLILVLWVISLPRYRIQYELFKLRKVEGIHEYFDIRMPWTIGWSVFIDVLLVSFFSTMILGQSELFKLLTSFVPS